MPTLIAPRMGPTPVAGTTPADAGRAPVATCVVVAAISTRGTVAPSGMRFPRRSETSDGAIHTGATLAAALADVAELVDAHGSGPCGGNSVEVRVLSSACKES